MEFGVFILFLLLMTSKYLQFFKRLSTEEKRDYLIQVTAVGNTKIDFITVIYKYLIESPGVSDTVLVFIYEFLQKLFTLQKNTYQQEEIQKMKKLIQKIQAKETSGKEDVDNIFHQL